MRDMSQWDRFERKRRPQVMMARQKGWIVVKSANHGSIQVDWQQTGAENVPAKLTELTTKRIRRQAINKLDSNQHNLAYRL